MEGGKAEATIITKGLEHLLGDGAEDVAESAAKKEAERVGEHAGEKAAQDAEEKAAQDAERKAAREGAEAGEDTAKKVGDRTATNDPIDVASGEVLLHQIDLELPGVLPLVLDRTHISSYRTGRWFGRSWASTVDQRLEVDESGACLVGTEGLVLVYPVPMAGEATLPERGPRWPLVYGDDGFTVTDPEQGRTLYFASQPNAGIPGSRASVLPLRAISDRNGNRIDLDYDGNGILTEVRHSGGYRIGVRTTDGRITELRLLSAADRPVLKRFEYDRAGRLTEVYNSVGQPTRFEYDAAGRMTRWTDTNGHWYAYTYDERGRGIAGEGPGGCLNTRLAYHDRMTVVTDSLGRDTIYHLNERGQLTAVVDPLGNTTWSEWDAYGRLLSRTDPLSHTTRYIRDENGDPVRIEQPDGTAVQVSYNGLRQPEIVIGPDGARWQYGYDERGNLTSVRDPGGATTRNQYDERGALVATVDALGQMTRYACDGAGLPVDVTGKLGARSRLDRDAFGRITSITDAVGAVSRIGWTVEGRPAWRVGPDGGREEWSYDGEGNLLKYHDPAGGLTSFEYGPFDIPVARTDPSGAGYRFAYDTELRLISVTNAMMNLSWRYEYDAAGNLLTETDFNGRVATYAYDAAGRLVERVNGAGEATTYVRDRAGRMIERHMHDGGHHRFTYDAAGLLVRAESPDSTLEYVRDKRGRVLAETVDGRTLTNRYDMLGRRLHRTTPSGTVSEWTYDALGLPARLTAPGGTLSFRYDNAGRETSRHLGPGVALSQEFDPSGRLVTQAAWSYDQQGQGTAPRLMQGRRYTYRPDGYPVEINDSSHGVRRYGLDPLGRVTAVHTPTWSETYAYDALGNTVQAAAPRDDDVRGARDCQGTLVRRAGRTTYEHDAQGRLVRTVRRTLSGQVRQGSYTWDAQDRLISATTPEGTWHYTYDPIGRRTAKRRIDGRGTVVDTTWYSWDGTRLAEQVTTTPDGRAHATSWDWEPDGHRPLTQIRRSWVLNASQSRIDTAFYAIVTNLAGTPTELVTPDGRIAWHQTTSLWGTPISSSPDELDCPLRFPGQYRDEETGLHYNLNRYYDPDTTAYISADPLGLWPAPNPHRYVENPLAWIDPLGLAAYKVVHENDAGRFGDLDPGVPGDGLTPHHMPQAALGFTSRDDGGAIVMTHADHVLTRTYGAAGRATRAAEAGLPFRTVLARDIQDIRRIGQLQHGDPAYFNPGITKLLSYYRSIGML
jgi:RHS repeat-associated protein